MNQKINGSRSMFSYFEFLTKYLLKKKSTWLAPIIFGVVFILISVIIGNFTGQTQSTNLNMFRTMTGMFAVVFFALFGMNKGINLFRDPSEEGIELLVVSKPLERWQIILVKFIVFNIVGFLFFLISIIIFSICAAVLKVDASSTFVSISIGVPVTNWLSYILFGTIGILISIKFNSKTILSVGMVTVMALTAADTFIGSFSDLFISSRTTEYAAKIDENNLTLKPFGQFIDEKGNSVPFLTNGQRASGNEITPTNRQINLSLLNKDMSAVNMWNESKDNSWQSQFALYLNPISAFNKVGQLGHLETQSTSKRTFNQINEEDYSWTAEVLDGKFSEWTGTDGTAYSFNGIDLNLKNKDAGKNYQQFVLGTQFTVVTSTGTTAKSGTFFAEEEGNQADLVKLIKSDIEKIDNIIDNKLGSITTTLATSGALTKDKVISEIKSKVLSDLDADFWKKYDDALVYIKGPEDKDKLKDWSNDQDAKANFIYYLSHLVVVNERYDLGNDKKTADWTNNPFRKAVDDAIFDLSRVPGPGAGRPFAEEVAADQAGPTQPQQANLFLEKGIQAGISKLPNAKMIKLVPHLRTQTWAIALLWIAIILGINAGTIFMYFREDFR